MSALTSAMDRVVVAVLAVLLLAGGAWALAWSLDLLPDGWAPGGELVVSLPAAWTDAAWWPVALGLAGLLAVAVGLWWLVAHVRQARVPELSLAGDGRGGRLVVEGKALASGAAGALQASDDDVTDARGRLVRERRAVVLDLVATVRPDADLARVARACDAVAAHAARSTGRRDLTCRARLKVPARTEARARVS